MKQRFGLAATAGALAVALILTACGGSDEGGGVASLTNATGQSAAGGSQSSGESGSPASEQDREEAALEFAQCMREHGVAMPDPVNGRFELRTERGDEAKVEKAQEACRHILEDAAPPPLDEEQRAELQEAALAFAKCMREHGIDMPDPQFEEGGGFLQQMPEGVDQAKVEEAQEACQPILEEARPDGPSVQSEST